MLRSYFFLGMLAMIQTSIYSESEVVQNVIHTNGGNDITLHSYELGINDYINNTPQCVRGSCKDWIDTSLSLLPVDARILEIGSAFGRDAQYIESFGYRVECTDAVESFVYILQKNGFSAHVFNVLTDDFNTTYDLIFANAVFLHFTPQELKNVVLKIRTALNDSGVLSFSLKIGSGEEWTTEKLNHLRYFCYWNMQSILTLMNETGYEVLCAEESEKFLHIIARPVHI